MARHGLTLDVFSVSHASGDAYPADAITFGTAPDQQSFIAFFSDPDYQAALSSSSRFAAAVAPGLLVDRGRSGHCNPRRTL